MLVLVHYGATALSISILSLMTQYNNKNVPYVASILVVTVVCDDMLGAFMLSVFIISIVVLSAVLLCIVVMTVVFIV